MRNLVKIKPIESLDIQSELERYVKPFTIIGRLLGLNIQLNLKEIKGPLPLRAAPFRVFHRLLVLFMGLLSVLQIIYFLFKLVQVECGFATCVLNFLLPTVFVSSGPTYAYVIRYEYEISSTLSKVIRTTAKHLESCPPVRAKSFLSKIRWWSTGIAILMVLFTVCAVTLIFAIHLNIVLAMDSDDYCPEYVGGNFSDHFIQLTGCRGYLMIDCFIDMINVGIFLSTSGLVSSSLMSVTMVILLVNFQIISEHWNHTNCDFPSQLRRHKAICDLVFSINEWCSFIVFAWFAVLIFEGLLFFRVLTSPQIKHHISLAAFFVTILLIFLKDFLVICAVNSKITSSLAYMCPNEISQFADSERHNGYSEIAQINVKVDYQMYCTNLKLNRPSITGWGFFSINRKFLLSVAATYMTYTLLLHNIDY